MVYPQGSIKTEMLNNENGICIFKAIVGYENENGEGIVLGTGTAYEKENSTFINKTSYIENCETSAVRKSIRNGRIWDRYISSKCRRSSECNNTTR